MNIESQVCNLELSKRLKKLGVTQESYFTWHKIENIKNFINEVAKYQWIISRPDFEFDKEKLCAAYNVAELGEMLPDFIWSKKLPSGKFESVPEVVNDGLNITLSETEADCRAKALIWCIENGVVKP